MSLPAIFAFDTLPPGVTVGTLGHGTRDLIIGQYRSTTKAFTASLPSGIADVPAVPTPRHVIAVVHLVPPSALPRVPTVALLDGEPQGGDLSHVVGLGYGVGADSCIRFVIV